MKTTIKIQYCFLFLIILGCKNDSVDVNINSSNSFNNHYISIDSTEYYVDIEYLNSINTGKPVCELKHGMILLYVDTVKMKITYGDFILGGMFDRVAELTKDSFPNTYIIKPEYHANSNNSNSKLIFNGNELIAKRNYTQIVYKKIKMKNPILDTIHCKDTVQFFKRATEVLVRSFYSKSLLNYEASIQEDTSANIFSQHELKKMIEENKVKMWCDCVPDTKEIDGKIYNLENPLVNNFSVNNRDFLYLVDYYSDSIIINEVEGFLKGYMCPEQRKYFIRKQKFIRTEK